ncbi:MAG: phosphate ABC transporter substrate-binding protein [Alphaproteobacteria bacterium]|nr:phosphate ABC transporter substrate-binding protein [Alphaproteobacteria bacterium]
MLKQVITASAALAFAASAGAVQAREQIRIVGSSTVFPFSTAVAETFGRTTDFKTPVVESTGSGGGLKLFCGGVGVGHPDMTNASRRIKQSEVDLCAANGVTEITEVKIGYDGIALGRSKAGGDLSLTKAQIFLALGKMVPVDGKLVPNPYMMWSQIDASLPATKIEVMGPPPTSGTRDAFVELVMREGAEHFPEIKALKADKNAFRSISDAMREDGAFVETGENDNLIVQKLQANPNAVGIFGFSFLDQNADVIKGSKVEGVEPTFDAIADGEYGVSRSLYFYVKKAHIGVVPGMLEFVEEFVSDKAYGEEGYLTDKGLIPLTEEEREAMTEQATGLVPLKL